MATEIEAKFQCREFEPFRVRLRELGAALSGRVLETNTIFDTPKRRLLGAGCGLRIRTAQPLSAESLPGAAPPALLTYKGPRAAGELKIREELETAIKELEVANVVPDMLNMDSIDVRDIIYNGDLKKKDFQGGI